MQKLEIKILNLSFDPESANPDSKVAARFKDYGEMVKNYTVLSLSNSEKDFWLNKNVRVVAVRKSFKFLSFFWVFLKGLEISKKEKFDLITVPDAYYGGLLALLISKITKAALEIQVHGFEKLSGLRKMIARFVLRRAQGIRVVSQRLKNEVAKKFRISDDRITIAPIFVDLIFHQRSAKESSEPFIFLYVARLVSVKNIKLGIEAISEISKERNVELWIVGDGPLKNSLELLVKSLKLQAIVKFFGRQENVWEFYEKADVFLLTSFSEGWPLVIIEALSFGLPIIMTPVGQEGDIIKNNENALIISQNDKDALVSAMKKLIESYNLRRELSLKAEQTFKNLPTKEEVLKKYLLSWGLTLKNSKN